ncbi:MAG: cobalamin biosynthesis protein CbiM [Planctomycetota bacterium]|nr:MAG: cobalamin biosynthesis protein CbiM [Planctomycetota bacterium]
MHMAEGILSLPIIAGGAACCAAGCLWALRSCGPEQVTRVGLMAAVFFTLSFIHVPLAGTSVHLLGCALLGFILGRQIWLALTIALSLQVLLLGYGGLTTIGVTATMLAIPGHAAGTLLRRSGHWPARWLGLFAFTLALLAIEAALVLAWLALSFSQAGVVSWWFVIAHQPVALVEGLLTAGAVCYLQRAQPGYFHPSIPAKWTAATGPGPGGAP